MLLLLSRCTSPVWIFHIPRIPALSYKGSKELRVGKKTLSSFSIVTIFLSFFKKKVSKVCGSLTKMIDPLFLLYSETLGAGKFDLHLAGLFNLMISDDEDVNKWY